MRDNSGLNWLVLLAISILVLMVCVWIFSQPIGRWARGFGM